MKLFTINIDAYILNRLLSTFNYVTGKNVTIASLGGKDNGIHAEFTAEPSYDDVAKLIVMVEENKDHIKTAVSSIITAFGAIKAVFDAMKATGKRIDKEKKEEDIKPYGSFTEPMNEREVA
jgi:hypothetical protein